ncbi:MAG TPA: hypothetical protein VNH18_23300 [Bryobacteraceae bacterium]|nr:hypothetical protein [Bryobacteraceae bacterium]
MSLSIVVLIVMTVVVAAFAGYRKMIARNEDDFIHMSDPTGKIAADQQHMAASLARLDRIGIAITVVTAVYGLILLGTALYQGLVHPSLQ